jgi:hypothetical protein
MFGQDKMYRGSGRCAPSRLFNGARFLVETTDTEIEVALASRQTSLTIYVHRRVSNTLDAEL